MASINWSVTPPQRQMSIINAAMDVVKQFFSSSSEYKEGADHFDVFDAKLDRKRFPSFLNAVGDKVGMMNSVKDALDEEKKGQRTVLRETIMLPSIRFTERDPVGFKAWKAWKPSVEKVARDFDLQHHGVSLGKDTTKNQTGGLYEKKEGWSGGALSDYKEGSQLQKKLLPLDLKAMYEGMSYDELMDTLTENEKKIPEVRKLLRAAAAREKAEDEVKIQASKTVINQVKNMNKLDLDKNVLSEQLAMEQLKDTIVPSLPKEYWKKGMNGFERDEEKNVLRNFKLQQELIKDKAALKYGKIKTKEVGLEKALEKQNNERMSMSAIVPKVTTPMNTNVYHNKDITVLQPIGIEGLNDKPDMLQKSKPNINMNDPAYLRSLYNFISLK